MGRSDLMGAAPGYEQWNIAISGYFFSTSGAGQPAYLQVDGDTLREVGPRAGASPEQAEESFVRAVRSKVSRGGANPFVWFLWLEDWRKQLRTEPATPPPFVGLLGLCALAASRMAADPEARIAAGNYYARLNELLGLSRTGRPPSFERVTALWEELGRWLSQDNDGRLGLPTATPHPSFPYIGYAISQCLLRDSDRRRLPDFFQWEGLAPGQDASAVELVPRLRAWASNHRCALSRQARKALTGGEELVRQAAGTVAAELKSWDGASVDPEGGRSARIEVRVSVRRGGRRFQYELYPRAPADFPGGEYRNGISGVSLERVPGTAWFGPLPDHLAREALGAGIYLRNGRYALRLGGARAMVLEKNEELGGWVSCPRIVAGQEHMVLCHSTLSGRVEERLRRAARPGWARAAGTSGLPSSWVCFRGVRIAGHAQAAAEDGDLDCLLPRWRAGISFSGGLKIAGDAWLSGGEPAVTVTASEEQATPVLLDGEPAGSLSGGSLVLDLAALGLGAGEHEIAVGEQRRRFRLARSGYSEGAATAARRLGHALHRGEGSFFPSSPSAEDILGAGEEPAGSVSVVGAMLSGAPEDIPDAVREALRLPRGYKRYAVLGSRPGEVAEYDLGAETPHWVLREVAKAGGHFEVPVTFEPQWIAAVGTGRREYLWPVGQPQPPGNPAAGGDVASWARWARKRYRNLKGVRKRAAWEDYRTAAEALDGMG